MSEISANLALPLLQPSQAQKHVTHNEALQRLDALTQIGVASATRTDPPAGPGEGARWLLPAGCTGAWAGRGGTLAAFQNGAWVFHDPRPGWLAWVADTGALMVRGAQDWEPAAAGAEIDSLDLLGINTAADTVNRLAVAADATLLSHAGAGHQLKLNKAAPGDTASLLFQTGWSGRAEMGLTGSDDFEIKTSADGSTFHTALRVDAGTGQVEFPGGLAGSGSPVPVEFGDGPPVTADYVAARGTGLVTNGTGLLGNSYNFPSEFSLDRAVTPNLPASFSYAGYNSPAIFMQESLAVDPHRVYRLSSYLRQEEPAGDWSAYPSGAAHQQYMGLSCSDADGLEIQSHHHMRWRDGGTDSRTALSAPLTPGDTVLHLEDAAGWNGTNTSTHNLGVILYGYRNSFGYLYGDYSRLVATGLFDPAGVDKTANTVTLNGPFPASMGNPDHPDGTWPAGTSLANSTRGSIYKYAFYTGLVVAQTDTWFRTLSHIGGIDRSGTNAPLNFPPGTGFVRPFWIANHTNRPGGFTTFADTGPAHRVWFAGISVEPEPLAAQQEAPDGSTALKVPVADFAAGTVTLAAPAVHVIAV